MGSAIDNTFPAAGVPVSKATFKTQLGYAKTELNHGGFFSQIGAAAGFTGQLERQTEQRLNDLPISVRDYGAVGDGTARPVSQWLSGGARDRGYANLAAIQVDYPHVTSASDEVDWAATQKALTVGSQVASQESRRIVVPAGVYRISGTLRLDRNVELVGEGVGSTWLIWTSALASGPCVQIKPTPSTATSNGCAVVDLLIDASAVLTTNLTNHGIEFYNTVRSRVRNVSISRTKGYGILMWFGTYFCQVDNVRIDRSDDTMICLKNGITASTTGYGDPQVTCNGNHFRNIFFEANYGPTPGPYRRPRLIEMSQPCEGNFFSDMQVQTGTYPLDDCYIWCNGTQSVIRNLHMYDGPGVSRTVTTSAGSAGKIRISFGSYLPNLVTGDKITATGITGITSGTLYALTAINEFVFDVTGTTYSGSPQTGRIVRGGSITATAAGPTGIIQVTCAEHGLWSGQQITVAGITGGSGAQSVIRINRNTFQLYGTTYGGSTQTGSWTIDRPTSLVTFGDIGLQTGYTGTKNVFEHNQVVCLHDASTSVYCALFTGFAHTNSVIKPIQDQAGTILPYLVENGAVGNRMREWPATSVTDGSSKLQEFDGFNINYSARLMCKDFGTSNPAIGDMLDGQVAFAVVGGVAKLYYKSGSTIYPFNSTTPVIT